MCISSACLTSFSLYGISLSVLHLFEINATLHTFNWDNEISAAALNLGFSVYQSLLTHATILQGCYKIEIKVRLLLLLL